MSSATLVSTTRTNRRPLAWAGTPLHRQQAQIRAVVRRRLGGRHFQLLSEPQPHDNDNTIDWYSSRRGTIQPLRDLPPDRQGQTRSDIGALLSDIDRLGQSLEAGGTEDARLAGKLLRFAAHGPSDEHLFLVDDQPVIACWGYDFQGTGIMPGGPAAAAPAAAGAPRAPSPAVAAAQAETPPAADPPEPAAPQPAAAAAPATVEPLPATTETKERRRRIGLAWLWWLLAGLGLALAILAALWAWGLFDPLPPATLTELHAAPADPEPRTSGAAPPVSRPPQGTLACSTATSSGGEGTTRNRHYLGNKPGTVTIRYDMQHRPDTLTVSYRGLVVATTGGPVSGPGTLTFSYQPEDGYYTVVVEVVGGDEGTKWSYVVGCPQ